MICLGENIKRLRREKGITQEALADFLSVSFQSVSRWERGESYPDITLLPLLSRFFGVSAAEFMRIVMTGHYHLSEEFKEKDEFREIVAMLGG